MTNLETVYTCPFGSKCVEIKDGKISRCMLYVTMQNMNAVTQQAEDKSECALTWNVILQHETNTRVFGVQQATESFRNEMMETNNHSNTVMATALAIASQQKLLGN